MKKLLVLLSFLFVFTIAPPVFAQTTDTELPNPGLLPDSPIYFLKPLTEKVRGLFVFGEDSKALYALTLADKRLSEAKTLSDKGKDDLASDTAEQAGIENENAQEHLAKAESEGKDVSAIVEQLAANSTRQQAVLAKVLEKVPEQAKVAIQRAMEMSERGLTKAQEMQTKEKGKPETIGKPDDVGRPSGTGTPGKPSGVGKPTNLPGGRP